MQLLRDNILLEAVSKKEKKSNIILPETITKERPELGKVVQFGPQVEGLKKGQIVLFSKYGPTEVQVEGKDYLIVKPEDVLAII